jgi:hypothetical protein
MANTIQIGADTSGFVQGVQRAETSMRGLAGSIQSATAPGMFDGLAGGFGKLLGGVGIMATLAAAARNFYNAMEAGGTLVDLSAQTGVAVDKLMVLQLAFEQAGMSAGDVQPVIAKLQKSVAEAATGNADAAAKFRTMGLSIQSLQGLSADEQLTAVGDAIGKIENPAQRSAMAMEIFGKSGAKLLSVFSAGGLEDVQANIGNQAELMVQNAGIFDRATDVLNTAGNKMQGFFVGMASQIMPPLMGAVEALNGLDLSGIGEAFGGAIASAIVLFQNFDAVGGIILDSLTLAFKTAANFYYDQMTTGIFKLGSLIKDAFTTAVSFLSQGFDAQIPKIYEKLKSALQSAGAFLSAAWTDIVPKVSVPLKLAFATGVNFFGELFTKTIPKLYVELKIAFANAINYLATMLQITFAKGAANAKALFTGSNPEQAAAKAEAEVRAKPLAIDVPALKKERDQIAEMPVKVIFDKTDLQRQYDDLDYKTSKPLFNTTKDLDEVQKGAQRLQELKNNILKEAREKNPTVQPPPAGVGFIPKIDDKPVGSIVSSMAKIGGDVGGPQTGALDLARQQLQAQQRTADNTAKLVQQMSRPSSSSTSGSVYQ